MTARCHAFDDPDPVIVVRMLNQNLAALVFRQSFSDPTVNIAIPQISIASFSPSTHDFLERRPRTNNFSYRWINLTVLLIAKDQSVFGVEDDKCFSDGVDRGSQHEFTFAKTLFCFLALRDVLMRARHQQGLAVLRPRCNPAAIQHPDPLAILVAHARLTLIERKFSSKVLFKQFSGNLDILWMDESHPGLDRHRIEFCQAVPNHFCPA